MGPVGERSAIVGEAHRRLRFRLTVAHIGNPSADFILYQNMADIPIQPIDRIFAAEVTPPGSKSLTNRSLVLAALAEGRSELRNVLFADDTRVMLECLGKLGFACDVDPAGHTVAVSGRGGIIPADGAELFCGNSGTTIRFLTALCSLGKGTFTLDGVPRMRQRPIGPLLELLRNAGVRCRSLLAENCPPVEVLADGIAGGLAQLEARIRRNFSRRFSRSPRWPGTRCGSIWSASRRAGLMC